jgi:FG-GAP-like repeat/FG-GAP repeat
MNSHKRTVGRALGSLTLLVAAVAFLPLATRAQTYLYGRADFQAGPNPTYVVVADFNGDGRPDMAVSNTQNNTVSILLGVPNGGFLLNGTYATGSAPISLVAADFNGDKKLDLAVVNGNGGTISILLGNGDGTLQGRTDYPVGENPVGIVVADFNGDGRIDLATLSVGDSALTLLLGNGNGSFDVQALIPVPQGPEALVGGDLNSDGKADVVLIANYGNTIATLLGKGDGTFTEVDSQGGAGPNLVLGDFNRDGKPDLVMNGYGALYIALGNGDGSFQNPTSIPNAPYAPGPVLAGDFNHDHKLDFAMGGIAVFLGNGDGTFTGPVYSSSGVYPQAAADINEDGELDLVSFTYAGAVSVLLGNGAGGFTDSSSVAISSGSSGGSAATSDDFNGDGHLDLAVAAGGYPNAQVYVELGKGNGTFKPPIVSALSSSSTNPYLMLSGDFNGDGTRDIVVLDDQSPGFQVLLGKGDGSFGTPVDNPLTDQVFSMAVGDFNRDGKADIVVTSGSSSNLSVSVYLGNGDGTFHLSMQNVVYQSSYVTVADVNGDGSPDLVVAGTGYYGPTNLLVFLGKGDGTFANPLFGPADSYNSQAAVADFNGDGKPDIAISTNSYGNVGIAFLPGNGDGTFGAQVYSSPSSQFSGILFASDVNGDGRADLVGQGQNSGAIVVPGNGDGTFGSPVEFDVPSNYRATPSAGDFNSDSVEDLAIPAEVYNEGYQDVVFLYLSTPAPSLRPTALKFPGEPVGQTSPPKKVRLSNIGNSKMKISTISVSGDFLETNNCGTRLAIGKSCTIQVSFKPTSKGIRTGEVSIADNAPGHAQKISLKGTGK